MKQSVFSLQRNSGSESKDDLDGDEFRDRKHALEIATTPANAQQFRRNLGFEKGHGGGNENSNVSSLLNP
tara:strand:+ start:52480 stop:52689 length:210 start_codon:yes stop_codon:yes gene_type:complete